MGDEPLSPPRHGARVFSMSSSSPRGFAAQESANTNSDPNTGVKSNSDAHSGTNSDSNLGSNSNSSSNSDSSKLGLVEAFVEALVEAYVVALVEGLIEALVEGGLLRQRQMGADDDELDERREEEHEEELDDELGEELEGGLLDVLVRLPPFVAGHLVLREEVQQGQVAGEKRRVDDEPLVLLPRCEGVVLEPLQLLRAKSELRAACAPGLAGAEQVVNVRDCRC